MDIPQYTYGAFPDDVAGLLHYAKGAGWIGDYEKVPITSISGRTQNRWLIKGLPATRYDTHFDPEATAELLLHGKEVLAFIEGCYAASKTNPIHRAGQRQPSSTTSHKYINQMFKQARAQREDASTEEEEAQAVDITDQQALPFSVDATAEEE